MRKGWIGVLQTLFGMFPFSRHERDCSILQKPKGHTCTFLYMTFLFYSQSFKYKNVRSNTLKAQNMTKQISIVLEETTLEQLEALRVQLGLLEIQDVIRLLIPEGLKRYKEEKKAKT